MGFFGKVFGPKEKKVETIETTLDLLPTLIEKDFEAKRKELEIVVAKKIAEIKYLHSKSLKLLEDITKKEIEEKENKRMNKAAFTSKKQIEKQLEKILTKIDPTNRGNNLDDIKALVGEGNSVLSNEIMAFRKNIVYTSVYLKDEMKALGEALQGMFTNFRELQKEIENVKEMFEFENIKNKINALNSLEIEKEKKQNEASEIKKLVEQKEKDITQSKKSLAELTRGKGAEELATIEKEKTQLAFEKQ